MCFKRIPEPYHLLESAVVVVVISLCTVTSFFIPVILQVSVSMFINTIFIAKLIDKASCSTYFENVKP